MNIFKTKNFRIVNKIVKINNQLLHEYKHNKATHRWHISASTEALIPRSPDLGTTQAAEDLYRLKVSGLALANAKTRKSFSYIFEDGNRINAIYCCEKRQVVAVRYSVDNAAFGTDTIWKVFTRNFNDWELRYCQYFNGYAHFSDFVYHSCLRHTINNVPTIFSVKEAEELLHEKPREKPRDNKSETAMGFRRHVSKYQTYQLPELAEMTIEVMG